MFNAKFSALSALALAAPMLVRAIVVPSEPGPGSSYTAGEECTISWEGDPDSETIWQDMSIQLMTGSNFEMVHLTTVATEQDGTVDGTFSFTCPEVDPYSAIYFYQFSSPLAEERTWATRFTITSPEGETVEPENPTQPGTGDEIPWGIGALADPSIAEPAPVFPGGDGEVSARPTSTSARPTSTTSSRLVTSSRPEPTASDDEDDEVQSSTRSQTGTGANPSASSLNNAGSVPTASLSLVAVVLSALSLFVFV